MCGQIAQAGRGLVGGSEDVGSNLMVVYEFSSPTLKVETEKLQERAGACGQIAQTVRRVYGECEVMGSNLMTVVTFKVQTPK